MTPAAVRLNSGHSMPAIGAGTWPFVGDEAQSVVESVIEVGYRMIDTAARYENEASVGRALAASGVTRADLFVTSKLRGRDQEAGHARPALEATLERLGLDYLDLYLIHFPMPRLDRYVSIFAQLVALADEGLVRSIGVSNFLDTHLTRIDQEIGITPAVNQIELDPTKARRELRVANDKRGIVTQSWSPVGRKGPVLDSPIVLKVAAAREITAGQCVLLWHRTLGLVPVVRTADRRRQADNLAVLGMPPLTADELAAFAILDAGEAAVLDSDTYEEF